MIRLQAVMEIFKIFDQGGVYTLPIFTEETLDYWWLDHIIKLIFVENGNLL